MRALLRDAEDQTLIALEAEEAVYDPEDQLLLLYAASGTNYEVSRIVRANADSMIKELAEKGFCDMTQLTETSASSRAERALIIAAKPKAFSPVLSSPSPLKSNKLPNKPLTVHISLPIIESFGGIRIIADALSKNTDRVRQKQQKM